MSKRLERFCATYNVDLIEKAMKDRTAGEAFSRILCGTSQLLDSFQWQLLLCFPRVKKIQQMSTEYAYISEEIEGINVSR